MVEFLFLEIRREFEFSDYLLMFFYTSKLQFT